MKKVLSMLCMAVATAVGLGATGCVQMPTEQQRDVDLRPQLSFRVTQPTLDPQQLRIVIDGLPMGVVADYLEGKRALRIIGGTHLLQVMYGAQVVLEEKMYVGNGMTKVVLVN
jgi:hypothetical protein